ncbi:S9 family peptidase [Halalkalibacter kiskunsagensis]|uniref:S9 family peptidase n=1 Tax=Halalkalibacter kiskunsagensis TaxID=1548599 RepID=A0ABV6KGN0_9BACI
MKHTITINEILNVKEPADRVYMSISCDNNWLAFCLSGEPVEEKSIGVSMAVEGNSQWVCNLKTGHTFPVAPEAKSSWAGVWSPDGKTLAFFSDIEGKARLWLWNSFSKTLKLASDLVVRPFFGFEKPIWTKDSQHIIVKSMPSVVIDDDDYYSFSNQDNIILIPDHSPKVYTTINTKAKEDKSNLNTWVNRYRADISMINVNTGFSTLLCSGLRPVGMEVSKDGHYLAITNCLGEERINTQQNIFELWICTLEFNGNHKTQRVATNIRMNYGLSFCWGHDNKSIYYTTSGPLSDGGLWLVNTSSVKHELLFKDEKTHLGHDYDPPKLLKNGNVVMIANGKLWYYSSNSRKLGEYLVQEGRCIVAGFPVSDDNQMLIQTHEPIEALDGFWEVNFITGETKKVLEEPKGHLPWYEGGAAYGDHENGKITYIFQDADRPPTLRVFDIGTKSELTVQLNKINTEQFGSSQIIRWKSNNRELRGALLLPKDIKKRVPAIIRVYGGSMQSKNIRLFGLSPMKCDNHQLFASRGVAVFLPDLPMSRSHEPADEITKAIEDAFDALAKHPNIDPNRIGIIGHSFGGYSTLVAITRLQHFKAAIVSAGLGNLVSFYTQVELKNSTPNFNYGWVEDGQANMGATLWEERERYIRNSPIFDFHKIETPVLLVQGTRDHLCHSEAGPMFSSLNRLDKVAQLVFYDEEHHQGTWRQENIEDYYKRVFAWLKKYL